ncbi:uroporphyrinogen decarboxylase family protein [Lachnospiraceae bacterium OttesenSCG-928-D06]|nr:uroporphyrinogen decarboxylase family protein [Lachnospiraceae bacterium OttesenSCG-928-D06]
MKQNMKQWIQEIIESPVKKAMPVLSFPAIQLMDITVRELISSSELQAEAMKKVAEHTNASASVSLMDLSVEAECFGSEIRFSDEEVPTVIGSIINSEEDAEALKIPKIGSARTGIYIEAIEKAVKLIEDRPVLAGAIGPFSLAGRLMSVTEAMIFCYEEPDMVHTVLVKVSEFIIRYAEAYKEAGANGIVLAEPLAGLLSPDLAKEFSADYVKKIIDAVQTDEFIVVYHNCGNCTIQQIDSIIDTGSPFLHFGNAIEMKDIMPLIPAHIIGSGNIDPAGQLRNGTVESVSAKTLEILQDCSKYPNFVISSGCDIPPFSKWENIHAFFDTVDTFYKEKE